MLANSGSGLEYVAAPAVVQNYPRGGRSAVPPLLGSQDGH